MLRTLAVEHSAYTSPGSPPGASSGMTLRANRMATQSRWTLLLLLLFCTCCLSLEAVEDLFSIAKISDYGVSSGESLAQWISCHSLTQRACEQFDHLKALASSDVGIRQNQHQLGLPVSSQHRFAGMQLSPRDVAFGDGDLG